MTVRSMTGFAQVRGRIDDELNFTLSLKSVNHRFLDLHLRMPPETDELEMKLRRVLKEGLARGHVDMTLSLERAGAGEVAINRPLVLGYVNTFRSLAQEVGLDCQPDLNAILALPGTLNGAKDSDLGAQLDPEVTAKLEEAVRKLNDMREAEGRSMVQELSERLQHLQLATEQVESLRESVAGAYLDKVHSRLQELIGARGDPDRMLQEAALLAERSDIREELVRMKAHIGHFSDLLREGGEIGKKMDFLLQEMNREANTLVSKTGGVAGAGLRITELGLAMKSEIEKLREQVQNLE